MPPTQLFHCRGHPLKKEYLICGTSFPWFKPSSKRNSHKFSFLFLSSFFFIPFVKYVLYLSQLLLSTLFFSALLSYNAQTKLYIPLNVQFDDLLYVCIMQGFSTFQHAINTSITSHIQLCVCVREDTHTLF